MNKEAILDRTKSHVKLVCENVQEREKNISDASEKLKKRFNSLSPEEQIVANRYLTDKDKEIAELAQIRKSPYFSRLEVEYKDEEDREKIVYIGKFGHLEENISSWTSPIAALRFENPGETDYYLPEGVFREVYLRSKDQIMVVDGVLKFLASESVDHSRELIYQEHFSNRKSGFMLPEIVAEMEKAQDRVIRADHFGPFLISGPAGSGKTTLAFHRVAYLLQQPDLNELFASNKTLVLVQDNGTKDYFSKLLPELGIDDVEINTFPEWAMRTLGLDMNYQMRIGKTEAEKDRYEYAKIKAMRSGNSANWNKANVFSVLQDIYFKFFDESQKSLFLSQREAKEVDRIDLTLLLLANLGAGGSLGCVRDYWIKLKNETYRKKHGFVPYKYSLMVVDEFQNYLPEQLRLLKSTLDSKSRAAVYVGDMAQQVRWGTVKNWDEIGESIEPERQVVLQKVYRNTKNILRYISDLGFNVEIPERLAEGESVKELRFESTAKRLDFIKNEIMSKSANTIGILGWNENDIGELKSAFSNDEKVHVLTFEESQGVEFDAVFLVSDIRSILSNLPNIDSPEADYNSEKAKIAKDLVYVALTRAISYLYILS